MARIFITGSADGLGQLAATALLQQGLNVVLHARNAERSRDALRKNPEAESVLTGDLANIQETKNLAKDVNNLGRFDAVIHNAGVYTASVEDMVAVNTLAPYLLTALIQKPGRLIYLSSGMHLHGRANPERMKSNSGHITYSDTKQQVVLLCMAVARKWTNVYANAVNPGWVPTRMGGRGAPDDLQKGYETQVWLAVSNDAAARVSGRYFFHQREGKHNPEADDTQLQEQFLALCEEMTGVAFPS